MRNYYEVLEIDDFSDAESVKAAHRKLSKQYHPDLNNGDKCFEEKFKEIQQAYEHLRDPELKALYDRSLLDEYYTPPEPGTPEQDWTAKEPEKWYRLQTLFHLP